MEAVSEMAGTPESVYRAALTAGKLVFQRCQCTHAWLPPRGECPRCLLADFRWEEACGSAKLISWVVYHRAYDSAFSDRLPYTVAIVELAEGPRLISNVIGTVDPEHLSIDQALILKVGEVEGVAIPQFEPITPDRETRSE